MATLLSAVTAPPPPNEAEQGEDADAGEVTLLRADPADSLADGSAAPAAPAEPAPPMGFFAAIKDMICTDLSTIYKKAE